MSIKHLTLAASSATFLFFSPLLSAANIVVNVNSDGSGAANECELRDAIIAANTDTEEDGCSAGDGDDLITFNLTSSFVTLSASLPLITESLEIAGPGVNELVIDGDDSHRIFDAAFQNGFLTIRGLNLFQGLGDFGGCLQVNLVDDLLVEDVRFEACGADTFTGGAVYVANTIGETATFRRVEFQGNTAEQGGGGMDLNTNIGLIVDCLFRSNQVVGAFSGGGGLAVGSFTDLTINRTTFWSNSATRYGTAVYVYNPNVTMAIRHSTISANDLTGATSFDTGGAINSAGDYSIFNSVVAGNTESNGFHDVVDILVGTGVVTTLGYNLIGNNEGSSGVFPAGVQVNGDRAGDNSSPLDAKLNTLADNGGPLPTAMPMPDSNLVDRGSCPGEVQDQRGFTNPLTGLRPVDTPGVPDTDDGCDTGSVEYLAEPLPLDFADSFES